MEARLIDGLVRYGDMNLENDLIASDRMFSLLLDSGLEGRMTWNQSMSAVLGVHEWVDRNYYLEHNYEWLVYTHQSWANDRSIGGLRLQHW